MVDAVIGKIVVNIEARIDKLEKQLAKGRKAVSSFGTQAGRAVGSGLSKFDKYLGITSVVSAGAFTAAIAKSTEAIDNLAKTSQTIGISTEALAGLRHAANLTGVETQTLDNSLRKMTIRISEARKGTGEAKDVIKELGLDIKSLAKQAPEQQFAEIAGAMQKVTNHADKVRMATKLFEEEGAKLVNTLALGKAGLTATAVEAQRLGLAIKAEDAAKVEKLADAWDRFKKATGSGFTELTIAIAPVAQEVLEGLTAAVRDVSILYKAMPKTGGSSAVGKAKAAYEGSGVFRFIEGVFTKATMAQSRNEGKITPEELKARGWTDVQIERRQAMMDRKLTHDKEVELATKAQQQKKKPELDLNFKPRLSVPNFSATLTSTFRQGLSDAIGGAIESIPSRMGTEAAVDNAMMRFGSGVESVRQASTNIEKRMEIAEEVRGRDRPDRAQVGIIEQGTSEAFTALRKNLYKSDDKQRELVAINKAMLKAGVEQKDYTKELVDWFKNAVAVGT